jgi:D-glycero-D-manno-heptose 1,7-bisphosphate phosphatase
VPAVGDSLRDLQASHAAGCTPWLVQTGNGPRTLAQGDLPRGTRLADSLSAMVDQLLADG